MQEGKRKVQTPGCTRFHKTSWNKIGSDTQIQTMYYHITEVNRLSTLVGSVRNLNTLLKYTLFLLHC